MNYKLLILLSFFSSIICLGQEGDTRDALPISVREKASQTYNGKVLETEYSQKLIEHINSLTEKYEEGESYRGYFRRGMNVVRNVIPSQAIGVKAISEVGFEIANWTLDKQSEKKLEDLKYNLDNLAKAVITSNQDLEITSEAFVNEVQALFFEANIKPQNYPILGRQFDKMIFDRLVENKEELDKFRIEIGGKIADLVNQGKSRDVAIAELQKVISEKDGEFASLQSSQSAIQKQLTELEVNIENRINTFVQKTMEWQEQVYSDMNVIGEKVADNEDKIEKNTVKIADLQKQVNSNSISIEEQSKKLKELQSLQIENRNLIQSNRVRIDAMGAVLYGEASTSGKIELLKKGLVNYGDDSAQMEEISRLENLQHWEEFNRDLAMGREVVQFASNMGLDKKTASDANKAIGTLSLVGQFAMSYPSNPKGMLSSINGAFALFGDGEEGGPDPAIMAEFAAIKQTLAEINSRIKILDEKSDSILARQFRFHLENMRQFSSLHKEIKTLEVKTDYIITLLANDCAVLDPDEYSLIGTIKERLSKQDITLNKYNELLMSFPNILPNILKCIDDNTQNLNLSTVEFCHMNRTSPSVVTSQFNTCLDYAKAIYGEPFLVEGLHYLPVNSNSIWQLINIGKNRNYNLEQAFSAMLNPSDLNQLVALYLAVYPYYLLEENHEVSTYQIWDEEKIVAVPKQVIIDRTETQLRKLKRLNRLTEYAIMQQSLLAGNKLFQHLNTDLGKSSSSRKSLAFEAIEKNQLMKMNLATFLINKYILIDSTSEVNFTKFVNSTHENSLSEEEINKWSNKLKNNWSFSQQKNSSGYSLYITTSLKINGTTKKLNLPLDLASILTNEIVYTNEALELLNTKEEIKSKLIEYEFQSILNSDPDSAFTIEFNKLYKNN